MTTIKPKTKIGKNAKPDLASKVKEESQVIVHCKFTSGDEPSMIRIWNSTFLVARGSYQPSKLVHTENISLFPLWTAVDRGQTLNFTLIFTALPKDCKVFDLVEEIPEAGGFSVLNIKRNKSDVYNVDLN